MKLGKLGINQILLLKRALKKKTIGVYDAKIIFNLPDSRRSSYQKSNERALIVLEKLETYGLLIRTPSESPWLWELTPDGKMFLLENLPKPLDQRVGALNVWIERFGG